MPMIVTAKLDFSAAHRLHNPGRDAEWNRRTYDKCDNPRGHGHNYILMVSVRGEIDPETGMVIDLKRLKDLVREHVINHVDHKSLNEDVPFLRGVIPTAENLAQSFWKQLEPVIDQGTLYEVVLQETERNSVVYRGEGKACLPFNNRQPSTVNHFKEAHMINYDLAMMALEGMGRSRLTVKHDGGEIRIEAKSQGFKELARLCLLLGSADVAEGEEFALSPGIHLDSGSPKVRLTLVGDENG